jgi:hypothetical protein
VGTISGMAIFTNTSGETRFFEKRWAFFLAAILGCYMMSCTKADKDFTPRVDTPAGPPVIPTGIITQFLVMDSLIGYGYQTIVKWTVMEGNIRTVVTLNGVKVGLNGGMQSGHLTTKTNFILAVNNGLTATKVVDVADPLTTYLWNDGKRWMPVNFFTYNRNLKTKGYFGQDSTYEGWESVYHLDSAKYSHERASFYLDGNTQEEQLSSSYPRPNPSGKIIVLSNTGKLAFHWKGRTYNIDSIANNILIMRFDTTLQNTNTIVSNRIHLTPEF